METGSEIVDAVMRRSRIVFAGFVARTEDTRLPNCVMSGGLMGSAGCVGGKKRCGRGVSWMISELSVLTSTSGRL